jgi:predicted TPR repeat methyltransferase
LAQKADGKSILENSYVLHTPDDNRSYYDSFASTYESDFVEAMGYSYPVSVANIYRSEAAAEDVPVADIGCGTGIVAEALLLPRHAVDGIDISPAMLQVAEQKQLYRHLIAADLTQDLGHFGSNYGGVVSAGTFTHGHLGPESLRSLLSIARRGALFVIGINEVHFGTHGFGDILDAMVREDLIRGLKTERLPIYAKQGHEHSGDHALVAVFRKT